MAVHVIFVRKIGEVWDHGVSRTDVGVVVQPPVWLTNAPGWMKQAGPYIVHDHSSTDSHSDGRYSIHYTVDDVRRCFKKVGASKLRVSDYRCERVIRTGRKLRNMLTKGDSTGATWHLHTPCLPHPGQCAKQC